MKIEESKKGKAVRCKPRNEDETNGFYDLMKSKIESNISTGKTRWVGDREMERRLSITRPDWKCGKCGKKYSLYEFIELMDINYESRRMPVCTCGYRFSLDKWILHDRLKIKIENKEVDILVSTADLEINHGFFDKDLWYETMVFGEGLGEHTQSLYTARYETKEQAEDEHNRILKLIKNGNYKMDKLGETEYKLIIC